MTEVTADTAPNVAAALIDALIASNRGDRHAFEFAKKTYSYQDVAALMNRTGSMVKRMGVEKGGTLLLLLPESPAWVASLLGAIKAGAVPVLGAPLDSPEALERCVATIAPSAAVVHHTYLDRMEKSLAGIARDAIVVVGADAGDYKSFVEEIRAQPSWLAAEPVSGNAPAIGIWTGSRLDKISHAEVGVFISENGELGGASGSPRAAKIVALLRTFAKGEEATLQ